MRSLRFKKLIITRVMGLVVVIMLVGAVIFAGGLVQQIRGKLIERQIRLEESLGNAVYQAKVADQLAQNEKDVTRIRDMVLWQDEIGQVVEVIDAEAKREGVTVLVPKISEEPTYNESGEKIEPTGPTRLIRLRVEGAGNPVALINFMHRVENLPYLINVVSFMLDTEREGVTIGSVALAPSAPRTADKEVLPTVKLALLKLELLLTVMAEEGK